MDTAEKVKYAQLDLLFELRRICEKHNIPYFLLGGTLIGAIRHNGFIPWDDDIDLGMFREDYERFCQVCQEELDPAYSLYDWHKDPHSPLPFLKLKINGTHYRESISANSKMDDSIFIDIFPFDNAPEDAGARKRQARKIYLVRKILLLRCGFDLAGGKLSKKLLYGILKLLSYFRSVKAWKHSCEKLLTLYRNQQTPYVVNMCSAYSYERERMERQVLEGQISHIFEIDWFSVPKNYDAFLTKVFGDYMKLPPEEQRTGRHGVLLTDLGDYQIRCVKGEE